MTGYLVRACGVLLMLTAFAISLARAPDRPVETLIARWAPPPSDFIEVRGQIVHIRDEGPTQAGNAGAVPIVLIHGTGASLHTWEGWVKALKNQRRVITFDLPGFGLTGPWSDTFNGDYPHANYEGDAYARFVLDLLDTLKIERVVLAGNSLGGEVAWRTAYIAPQRVASLVLVDAAGPPFVPARIPLGFRIARIPLLNRVMEWLLPRGIVEKSVAAVYGDPSKVSTEVVDRYFELTLREGNRRALATRMQHVVPGENAERIATLKLPTLILWGGRDRLIPPDAGTYFLQSIAGSRRIVFADLGHVPQEEGPAETVAAVRDFLQLR